MPALIPYIIKLSIGLSFIYLFYQLVLRRLTFYNWNRWYLLLYSLLCFVLPFINVFNILEQGGLQNAAIINYIPAVDQIAQQDQLPEASAQINWQTIYFIVLLAGVLVMLIRLMIQYRSLQKIRSGAVLLYDNGIKLYHVNKPVIPFSFGNAIYINQQLHGEDELKEIIRHEFIHVKQRHSADILWSEILCMLNWYNPFAWLIRKAIRQNLEFIADNQVLKTGLDRKQYQYLLLKTTGISTFHIASNFNLSSLKKRIAMMNKVKSARVHLIRFLFVLPVLAVIILAFRGVAQKNSRTQQVIITDTVPAKGFPADVRSIQSSGTIMKVTKKNGQVETYNMQRPAEKEVFEEKYGDIKPPAPPVPPYQPVIAGTSAMTRVYDISDYNCINSKGYCITIADNMGECVVIVKDKNKKIIEAVALTDWNKDKNYGEKYGEIPPPPPPEPSADMRPVVVEGFAIPVAPSPGVRPITVEGFAKPLAPTADVRPVIVEGVPVAPIAPAVHRLRKNVSRMEINNKRATVTLKNGTVEWYDLDKPEEKAVFEKKYGRVIEVDSPRSAD
jgi:beta-lactamase regulating signal transducer with metallopeptidase domain